MVQYIFTPWRDHRELLAVRRQFYPDLVDGRPAAEATLAAAQQLAVARVAVWMQRGHCPHMVESTALLVAATLADTDASPAVAAYAVRAAYAAAFGRFVTGLLDGQQDRARKLSMYSLARSIGLPAAFVELRHQATHESLPSRARLRAAARRALLWIWQYYWVHLGAVAAASESQETHASETAAATVRREDNDCRAAVLRFVDETAGSVSSVSSSADDDTLARYVHTWGHARVLAVLSAVSPADGDSSPARVLRCLRLSQQLMVPKTAPPQQEHRWTADNVDVNAMRAHLEHDRQALYRPGQTDEDESPTEAMAVDEPEAPASQSLPQPQPQPEMPATRPQWKRYEGDWTPRPIGVV